jgi:hypothetical protein
MTAQIEINCAESIVNGRRVPVHRPEDCIYTRKRSALVEQAPLLATMRGNGNGDWARCFSEAVSALSAAVTLPIR